MRSNYKLFPLLCLFFFAALGSASLLFKPSTSRHTEKRALLDTNNAGGLTNAKRLAAGLPPLPPRTRTDTAKRSAVSLISVSGRIQVLDTSGSILGYAARHSSGRIHVEDITLGDTFSFAIAPGVVNSQINIRDTTAPDAYPYLAAFLNYSTDELSPGKYALESLGLSSATFAGDTPQAGGSASLTGQHESAIWTYDPTNGNIGVQWVNHDGSTYPTTIMYNGGARELYITGDVGEIRKWNPLPPKVVTFRLV